jgi:RNA polymerase sigma-70 factor (ECF subfamily)
MNAEDFREAFKTEIKDVLACGARQYSLSDEEVGRAIYSSVSKYLPETMAGDRRAGGDPSKNGKMAASREAVGFAEISAFIESLNGEDLCLAVACAKGDEAAWEDFFRDYRSYLISIARSVTQDAGAAEQLADSTFAELYGLRESGGARVSKFSFYSGRGSLRGWLRAVVLQLSADLHRKTSRFVQTDEPEDLDRIAAAAVHPAPPAAETEFVGRRYRTAVSEALRLAVGQIEPRERLLLSHYYYDEMTMREIGRIFGVHEATICRWLTKVQSRVRKLVEKGLARDHRFNRRQVKEAVEFAAEAADISIGEYLFASISSDRRSVKDADRKENAAI